jgi:hypothetical protein
MGCCPHTALGMLCNIRYMHSDAFLKCNKILPETHLVPAVSDMGLWVRIYVI